MHAKGLGNAVKQVFPHAEHRECFRHLIHNLIKRLGGDVFSKMYISTGRSYRPEVFQYFSMKLWWLSLKYWNGFRITTNCRGCEVPSILKSRVIMLPTTLQNVSIIGPRIRRT
jgi:hypothetical protein